MKRDGVRQAERRKEGDGGGDGGSIWSMFTVISLGPDVIVDCIWWIRMSHQTAGSFPLLCLVALPLFTRETRPCIVLLHYLCRNPLCLHVCPASTYCSTVSLLYTLCSVLGPSQSNKAMMGSGLVQANINNPPSSSKGRERQRLRNGLLGYRESTDLRSAVTNVDTKIGWIKATA